MLLENVGRSRTISSSTVAKSSSPPPRLARSRHRRGTSWEKSPTTSATIRPAPRLCPPSTRWNRPSPTHGVRAVTPGPESRSIASLWSQLPRNRYCSIGALMTGIRQPFEKHCLRDSERLYPEVVQMVYISSVIDIEAEGACRALPDGGDNVKALFLEAANVIALAGQSTAPTRP